VSDAGFILRLAWRDARASWRRLLMLTASVTLGVAALVAINSFTDNLRTSVAEQAQALLGADLALTARQPLDSSAAARRLIDSLTAHPGVSMARSVSLTAMAYRPASGTARLVQLRTVDPGWPFYGAITTAPAAAWPTLQSGTIIVDPSLLGALGAAIGDTLVVGEGRFVIAGTVVNVPGEVGLQSAFGARVFISSSALQRTRLLGFGSRAEYQVAFRLPTAVAPQPIADAHRQELRQERIRIRTVADDSGDLSERLSRLGNFLGLVALAALLLGGLGTASAIGVVIRQRLRTIAVLRCVGATSRQVVLAFLLQATLMGLLGALIGAVLGVALQQIIPLVLHDMLPVDVRVAPSPRAILLGVRLGSWTALVFALLPLLDIRSVPPLATLRHDGAPVARRRDAAWLATLALLVVSVIGLAASQTGSLTEGTWFAVAAAVALAVLWGTARGLMGAARRLTPRDGSYLLRQGIANLHRPGNQTTTVVVSLGFGAFLLATLFTAQANLLGDLRVEHDSERPNLVFIDIQPDQQSVVREVLGAEGLSLTSTTPIVAMRIAEVDGQPVTALLAGADTAADSTAQGGDPTDRGTGLWAVRREYRSTWRGELGPAETIVRGRWFDTTDTGDGRSAAHPAAISVEQDLAGELGIGVGSRLVWDVQGVRVWSVVRSLRTVNWARFEPNFFVVFAPGTLDGAPQTSVSLARVLDPVARGRIQRIMAERAANVTTVDLGELQQTLERIVSRIIVAIRFMAAFSLATGVVVLIGAIVTSRWQRVREGTLLRALGATRGQVLVILAVEYAALGVAASVIAAGLAGAAGWALARWFFGTRFVLPAGSLGLLAIAMVVLTVGVGLAGSLPVLRRPPLDVLRSD
jgi:putative ABC transport system permease protein